MSPSARRWLGALSILVGVLLLAVGVAAFVLAQNLSEFGFASFRHAAPIPIAGVVVGAGAIALGIASLRRARRG